MAFPTIKFNNSTGSDTAASGAGPTTAVTGTAAAHTDGATTNVITLTNSPDLSGVAKDGSAALWLKTASGRQFTKITDVDNTAKTVTVISNFTIASGSAVNYAIGGKRSGLTSADSRFVFVDAMAGWTIEFENTGTNYSWDQAELVPTGIGNTTDGPITVRGTGSTRVVLQVNQTSATAVAVANVAATAAFWIWENLDFRRYRESSANSRSVINMIAAGEGVWRFTNCAFRQTGGQEKQANGISWTRNSSTVALIAEKCFFSKCSTALSRSAGTAAVTAVIDRCVFDDCVIGVSFGGHNLTINNCIFIENDTYDIEMPDIGTSSNKGGFITGNVFNRSNGDSIRLGTSSCQGMIASGNIFTYSGGYDVNYQGGGIPILEIDGNASFGSTSGHKLNLAVGTNDITLTVNPFVAPFRATAVAWDHDTLTLTKAGLFADAVAGHFVRVTGGTGVTPGLYEIASKTSDNAVVLKASIGADAIDVVLDYNFNLNNLANGGKLLRDATLGLGT